MDMLIACKMTPQEAWKRLDGKGTPEEKAAVQQQINQYIDALSREERIAFLKEFALQGKTEMDEYVNKLDEEKKEAFQDWMRKK
jgi:phage portal protein BeeE